MIPEAFTAAILAEVQRQVERLGKEVLENAKKELERRIPEVVAGTMLRVQSHVSFERLGQEIVCSVRLVPPKGEAG